MASLTKECVTSQKHAKTAVHTGIEASIAVHVAVTPNTPTKTEHAESESAAYAEDNAAVELGMTQATLEQGTLSINYCEKVVRRKEMAPMQATRALVRAKASEYRVSSTNVFFAGIAS